MTTPSSQSTGFEAEVFASYPPAAVFAEQANAMAELYERADQDRLAFWGERAQRLVWDTPFSEVLDWSEAPLAKWFVGGRLNVAYNCVDRHVEAGNGDRVAIHWVGEPEADERTITYAQLKGEVGLRAGDRVAIYMPMVPEAIVAMLACARLGALHSVVFAGFSASALKARISDAEAKLVITTDTSGTTGKPKGIVHTTGGYLTQTSYTHFNVFDVKPESDVFWCTADIGWVTGHSYIVYGPLSNGVTQVVRGHPGVADLAPALRDRREVRRHHLLHGADVDPHLHEAGPSDPRRPRSVEPAAVGFGG